MNSEGVMYFLMMDCKKPSQPFILARQNQRAVDFVLVLRILVGLMLI